MVLRHPSVSHCVGLGRKNTIREKKEDGEIGEGSRGPGAGGGDAVRMKGKVGR